MRLLPVRHDQRQPIQDQLAEAGIILGEIIDLGLIALRRRADLLRLAIKIGWTPRLEVEVDRIVARVEAVHRLTGRAPVIIELHQTQYICREITVLIEVNYQIIVEGRIGLVMDPQSGHANIEDAASPGDSDVGFLHLGRRLAEEENLKAKLIVAYFNEVKAEQRGLPHIVAAPFFPA